MNCVIFVRLLALTLAACSLAHRGFTLPRHEGQAVRAYITNFGSDYVSVFDPGQRRIVASIKTGSHPFGVSIAPDGKAVYVSNEDDGTLSILDPATNTVTATIPVGKRPHHLAVSADGRYVFVAIYGADDVAVVDVSARQVVKRITIGRSPHMVLRSPDGKTIYANSEGDMKIVAINAAMCEVTGEIPLEGCPRPMAIPSDGTAIYQTIRWLNGVLVIDPARQQVVDCLSFGEQKFYAEGRSAHGLAITADGAQLWATTQNTDTVTVLDTHSHRILGRIAVEREPNWIAFTPDSHWAIVSNTLTNTISLLSVAERRVVATEPVGPQPKRLAVGWVASE